MKYGKIQVFRYKGGRRPRWAVILFTLFLAGVMTFAALFGAVAHGMKDQVYGQPDVMIILGCQVKPWGPSILLQDRLDEALDYLEAHPDMTIVVSGGQGPDEPSTEARAMADYLLAQGVPEENILLEERSSNTMENLRYTKELLEQQGMDVEDGVLVVSNGFHLTRTRMLAQREGYGKISTLAAPSSHVPSRIKMYVREPLALAKSFLLDR